MDERAILLALAERLSDPTLRVRLTKVGAHQHGAASRNAFGNTDVDGATKHLRVRNNQDSEPVCLRAHDGHYVVTITPNHAEGAPNRTFHVLGPRREAIKNHFKETTKSAALRADSTQSTTARDYHDEENVVAGRVAAPPSPELRAKTFFKVATDLGRRARGAEGTPLALTASTSEFFARLASATLPTLAAAAARHPAATAAEVATKIKAAAKKSARYRFALAGIRRPARNGPGPAEPTFSPQCPLCPGAGHLDDQGHFCSCASTQGAWQRAVSDALASAVSASALLQQQRTQGMIAAMTAFVLDPRGHFTRRCGFFTDRPALRAFNSAFGPNSALQPKPFLNILRLELLRSAAAVFALRQVLLIASIAADGAFPPPGP